MQRPEAPLVERARACAMADLYEALPADARAAALMSGRMSPLALGIRMAGPAITVRCAPGDNLMMHRALLLAQRGDVLVVDGGKPSAAQWGMLAEVYAARKGIAGVVVAGCVRDVDYLREQHAAVWCTEISPAHPEKVGPGAINVPIVCAGVGVRPGDLISADADGVLVIPRDMAAPAVAGACARAEHEKQGIAAIEAGRSLFEVHGLHAALARSGVAEIDASWPETAPAPRGTG